MLEKDIELVIGALLHDIGKVIYREGSDRRTHSQSGYDYLKNNVGISNKNILDSVRYHHADALRSTSLENDSLAYIVYIADNIASSVDRRTTQNEESGFEIHTPLQPVFNLLNGNDGKKYYSTSDININESINYPIDEKKNFQPEQYRRIIEQIYDNLKGIKKDNSIGQEYINSLIETLESNLSFVPSATSKSEVPDVSLFDHLKLTAAFSSAIKKYLEENSINDYRQKLYKNGDKFYSEKAFMIASLDISGIQNFIYTINTKGALKMLRARSFYLEIMMEHLIDELVEKQNLTRANLMYSGGGHCYLILPNTNEAKDNFDKYITETNKWFLDNFRTGLYIAGGYSECSADDLKNIPNGAYTQVFKKLSEKISEQKLRRYSAKDIIRLNTRISDDYTRECSVCKNIDKVNDKGRCSLCEVMENLSARVLYTDFFTITCKSAKDSLPLPGGFSMAYDDEDSLKQKMLNNNYYVRAYSKNKPYTGHHIATKLWVGNYNTKATFEEFAQSSKGIKRVGILRADVDNLGAAFVSGFRNKNNGDKYVTISRTATLSRQLSQFFKLHINKILENPEFTLDGEIKKRRNATIVYSGGDDVFVVGAWNEIIEFAVDLRNAFERYTEGTLSISAGIGIYDDGYPISVSALEVEEMVDASKKMPGKDSVTLLEDGYVHKGISDGSYKWKEFEDKVVLEKLKTISNYMDIVEDTHGNAFLYRIIELLRCQDDKINFARFVYMIARLEPQADAPDEIKNSFGDFSKKMITWVQDENSRIQLKTAIELYVYLNREEKEEKKDEDDKRR